MFRSTTLSPWAATFSSGTNTSDKVAQKTAATDNNIPFLIGGGLNHTLDVTDLILLCALKILRN
jgi:hypothetical protein